MENQNFQTSFIPKKPLSSDEGKRPRRKKKGMSLITMIAIFIFVISLIAAGGVFAYRSILNNQIEEKKTALEEARATFDPARVERLQDFDRRLKVANQLLDNHTLVSPIFTILEEVTMKSVRFTSINISFGGEENPAIVADLAGEARSYTSIALQSDLLASNQYILDPIFTDLNLDQNGNVLFSLSYTIDPELVSYQAYFDRLQATEAQEEVVDDEVQEEAVGDEEEVTNEAADTTNEPATDTPESGASGTSVEL